MNYSLLKDKDLLQLLQRSDTRAFEEMYQRYWEVVFKYAVGKAHTQQTAEDLCQDVFVSLWQRRSVAVIQNLEAYLVQATKYGVLNHIRLQVQNRKHFDFAKDRQGFVAETENPAAFRNLMEAWQKALALLPPKTREVFRLSKLEDYSNKEISNVLQVTEKAVEYHITKSNKFIRYQLRDFVVLALAFFFS